MKVFFHLQVRDARRQKSLTQAELARQAGCTQSALSMFESGQGAALATETLRKIAELLGLAFEEPAPVAVATPFALPRRVFCPNFQCPSAVPYFVGGELLIRPGFYDAQGAEKYCPHCGEVCVATCPTCHAAVGKEPGACCKVCGKALVPATLPEDWEAREWVRQRREERAEWIQFAR